MDEFTGSIAHKGLIVGDQRYIGELKTSRLEDVFYLANLIKMMSNTKFLWQLNIPENTFIITVIEE